MQTERLNHYVWELKRAKEGHQPEKDRVSVLDGNIRALQTQIEDLEAQKAALVAQFVPPNPEMLRGLILAVQSAFTADEANEIFAAAEVVVEDSTAPEPTDESQGLVNRWIKMIGNSFHAKVGKVINVQKPEFVKDTVLFVQFGDGPVTPTNWLPILLSKEGTDWEFTQPPAPVQQESLGQTPPPVAPQPTQQELEAKYKGKRVKLLDDRVGVIKAVTTAEGELPKLQIMFEDGSYVEMTPDDEKYSWNFYPLTQAELNSKYLDKWVVILGSRKTAQITSVRLDDEDGEVMLQMCFSDHESDYIISRPKDEGTSWEFCEAPIPERMTLEQAREKYLGKKVRILKGRKNIGKTSEVRSMDPIKDKPGVFKMLVKFGPGQKNSTTVQTNMLGINWELVEESPAPAEEAQPAAPKPVRQKPGPKPGSKKAVVAKKVPTKVAKQPKKGKPGRKLMVITKDNVLSLKGKRVLMMEGVYKNEKGKICLVMTMNGRDDCWTVTIIFKDKTTTSVRTSTYGKTWKLA